MAILRAMVAAAAVAIAQGGGSCRATPGLAFHATCLQVHPAQINTEVVFLIFNACACPAHIYLEFAGGCPPSFSTNLRAYGLGESHMINGAAAGTITVGWLSDVQAVDWCQVTFRHADRSNGRSASFTLEIPEGDPENRLIWGNTTYGVATWPITWPQYTAAGVWEATQLACHQGGSSTPFFYQRTGSATSIIIFGDDSTTEQLGHGDVNRPRLDGASFSRSTVYTQSTDPALSSVTVAVDFDDLPDRAGIRSVALFLWGGPSVGQIVRRWPASGSLLSGNISCGTVGFAFDFGGMNAVGPPGTYGFLKLEITDNTDSSYFVCWGGCTVGMFSPWAFLIAQAFGVGDGVRPEFVVTDADPPPTTSEPTPAPTTSEPNPIPTAPPAHPTPSPTTPIPTAPPSVGAGATRPPSSTPVTVTVPPPPPTAASAADSASGEVDQESGATVPLAIVFAVLFVAVIAGFVLNKRSGREADTANPTRVLTNSTYDAPAGGGGGGMLPDVSHAELEAGHNQVWGKLVPSLLDSNSQPTPSPTYASIEELQTPDSTGTGAQLGHGSSVRDSVRLSMDLDDFALPGDRKPRPVPLAIAEDGHHTGAPGPASATESEPDFDGYLNVAAVESAEASAPGSPGKQRSETAF